MNKSPLFFNFDLILAKNIGGRALKSYHLACLNIDQILNPLCFKSGGYSSKLYVPGERSETGKFTDFSFDERTSLFLSNFSFKDWIHEKKLYK